MKVTGWPNNVNNHILVETSITTGEGGTVEDSSSNGFKMRRATSLVTPRKFNVTMDFDWGGDGSEFQFPKDDNNFTEYDRFIRWFEFEHRKGTVPFWFPCITKQSIDNLQPDEQSKMCLYKITSSLNESQSGFSQRITMTWEEVYSGIISFQTPAVETMEVYGKNGKAKVVLNSIPTVTPLVSDFTITVKNELDTDVPTVINEVTCKNDIVSIFFEPTTDGALFTAYITYKDKTLSYSYKG